MNKAELIRDLESLDYALAESGLKGRILIVGSASLLLGDSGFDRETRDVDVIECSPEVLSLLHVCVGNFSNAVETLSGQTPPLAVIEDVDLGLTQLCVERFSDETIAAMKLRAHRPHDIDDVMQIMKSLDKTVLVEMLQDQMYRATFESDDEYFEMLDIASKILDQVIEPREWANKNAKTNE